jgi:UDP-3-O-[3-hydroxymyristoyl] glucosamine N-acyltransferase
VRIGEEVEIGALATVCSGASDPSIVKDGAKIDDHVFVAHNCHLSEQVVVVACAETSGSVKVGARTWLAPNCCVTNGISIGRDSVIGLGAVVTKSAGDDTTVVGNPARPLGERSRHGEAARGGSEQNDR